MAFGIILFVAVGLLLIALGLVIWKKQKITLLHDYHCKNVKLEDIPAYTRSMGIGLIVMGIGLCLTGILQILPDRIFTWIPLAANTAAGLFIMHKAQMKYNGSWFS